MRTAPLPIKLTIKEVIGYFEMAPMTSRQQLCGHVNNGDFPLYKQDGTRVENIVYKFPSLFDKGYDPHNIKPFIVNGIAYPEDDFYCIREEIYKFRREDLNQDDVNKVPTGTADYLDPASKNYAQEMDLATQLHKAIFTNGFGSFGADRLDTVNAWLNLNYPDLNPSDAMLKRLSTIIGNKSKK